MKYLLTLLCLGFGIPGNAQMSIGARTGASYQFRIDDASKRGAAYTPLPPEICWDKELFGRYSVKRFSFEVSVSHTKQTNYYFQNFPYTIYYQTPPKYVSSITTTTENFFVFNTLVQINTNSWGKSRRLKNHIGLSLSPQYRHIKKRTTLERYDGTTIEKETEKEKLFVIIPGVDQSLTYDANDHLQFSSHIFFRAYPYSEIPGYRTNSQVAFQIGAAYTISHKPSK